MESEEGACSDAGRSGTGPNGLSPQRQRDRKTVTFVGYRAAVQGEVLSLSLGYSHEIKYVIPKGIKIAVDKQTALAISGIDRQRVGQVAAEIRALRGPEPYKGKGVKYSDERIRRKEGKKK